MAKAKGARIKPCACLLWEEHLAHAKSGGAR